MTGAGFGVPHSIQNFPVLTAPQEQVQEAAEGAVAGASAAGAEGLAGAGLGAVGVGLTGGVLFCC